MPAASIGFLLKLPQSCGPRLFSWLTKKLGSAFRIVATFRESVPVPSFKPNSVLGNLVAYSLSVRSDIPKNILSQQKHSPELPAEKTVALSCAWRF
jgi:hypothetical protein